MKETAEDRRFQRWMTQWWRPVMAYMYMAICLFDFIFAPILWAVVQSLQGMQLTAQWVPLTLQGAGLFHVAMGAILGVSAWGRSQEKMAIMGTQFGSPQVIEPKNLPTRDNVNKGTVVYGREE
jgi:hypothetical protein